MMETFALVLVAFAFGIAGTLYVVQPLLEVDRRAPPPGPAPTWGRSWPEREDLHFTRDVLPETGERVLFYVDRGNGGAIAGWCIGTYFPHPAESAPWLDDAGSSFKTSSVAAWTELPPVPRG